MLLPRGLGAFGAGVLALLALTLGAEGCGSRDQLGFGPARDGDAPGGGGPAGGGPGGGGLAGGGGFGGGGSSQGGFGAGPVSTGVGGVGPTTTGVGGFGAGPVATVGVGGFGGMGPVTTVGVGGFGGMGPVTTVGVGGFGPTSTGVGAQGGGPLDCINCITQSCPSAIQCLTNPVCLQGVACSVQSCFTMGQPDFICVLDCFNGDLNAAITALQAIGCIFGQCGNVCQGLFP